MPDPPYHNLPIEVLYLICSQFCAHCQDQRLSARSPMGSDSKRTLLSLSLSSRLLRSVAQPLLYHRIPRWYSWLLLLRTLRMRPDLAGCVRQFEQLRYDVAPWANDRELQEVKDAARELLLEVPGDAEFGSAQREDVSPHNFCLEVLLSCFPNLQSLHMLLEKEGHHPETGLPHLAHRFSSLKAAGLPQLRHLKIDTECISGYDLHNPGVLALLSAAPNLEQLVMCRTRGLPGEVTTAFLPPLPRLRALELNKSLLDNNMDKNDVQDGHMDVLARVVRGSPRLEHFRVHSRGVYRGEYLDLLLPVRRVLEALWPQRRVLRFLDMDLTKHSLEPSTRRRSFSEDDGGLVTEFVALETLKLDETLVCRHGEDPGRKEATCLTRVMPPKLKKLVVRLFERSSMWDDLVVLGERVGEGEFPRLETVQVNMMRRPRSVMDAKGFAKEIKVNEVRVRDAFTSSRCHVELEFHQRASALDAKEVDSYVRGVF